MAFTSTIAGVVGITDILIPVALLTVWLALKRCDPEAAALRPFGLTLLAALMWGALWVWWPTLAALRTLPPPFGQIMPIFGVIIGMTALLLRSDVRNLLRNVNLNGLAAMGVWRMIFGSALLLIGLMEGLPPTFFWSAAFGDIAVGLWGMAIMARRFDVSNREIVGWNLVGLLDLVHVLAIGAVTLRPFYLANPDVQPLNLLPLVGVPVFVALHVLTLWARSVRHRSSRLPIANVLAS